MKYMKKVMAVELVLEGLRPLGLIRADMVRIFIKGLDLKAARLVAVEDLPIIQN
jgi:hypothetical protein